MKKLLFLLAFALLTQGVFAQWGFMTREQRDDLQDLTEAPILQYAFADSAITISATEDTWHDVTNATNTLWTATSSGLITTAGDSVTIVTAGHYVAMLSLDLLATADDTIHVRIEKNDSTAMTPKAEVLCIGPEIINLAVPYAFTSLSAGDDLKVQVMNSNNGDDPIILNGSLLIYMLKPE